MVAAKAYLEAVCDGKFVLIISRSEHQAFEFFEKVMQCYKWRPLVATAREPTMSELRLANGGRILALPHSENTVVGYSAVDLLVLDEAARISDGVYRAVKPMLAVKRGRSISLSTPYGQRGFFWNQWKACDEIERRNNLIRANGDGAALKVPYARCRIPWQQCPRITPEFIESERAENGDLHIAQEFECSFLPSVLDCAFDVARMEDLLSNLQDNAVL